MRLIALQYKAFEPELRHLDHFVPDDKTAVDIGTWWGPWSWWLARRAPRVEAFEPNGAICEELARVLPPNVTLRNLALSDLRGRATLWSPSTDFGTEGRSSLVPNDRDGWVCQTVETVALDELGLTDVGFVKIDVEGFELTVLHGATGLLAQQRPNVLVEIEQAHTSGEHMDDVFALLSNLGYAGSFLGDDSSWHPLEEFDRERTRSIGEKRKATGLLRSTFSRQRYINNFLFTPARRQRSIGIPGRNHALIPEPLRGDLGLREGLPRSGGRRPSPMILK